MLKDNIFRYKYRPIDFRRMIRSIDFWVFNDINEENIEEKTETISRLFAESNQKVDDIKYSFVRNKCIYTSNTLYDTLAIRLTNNILNRTLCIDIQPRDREIKQLWHIIDKENNGMYVFRTDIKSFFESLPFKEIILDLKTKNKVSQTIYNHLSNICNYTSSIGYSGLPRGLSISSSLSEYAMSIFDKAILTNIQCIYYSRYVDDMVIVSNNPDLKEIITKLLPYNLKLNEKKTYLAKIGDKSKVDFLGYSFNLDNVMETSISIKKINKIKSRIILSLKDYLNNKDFKLLLDRLRFLSGNSKLNIAGRKKILTAGLRYQYNLCSEDIVCSQLAEIDKFYKSILLSRTYKLTRQIKSVITKNDFDQLKRISFQKGYLSKMTHKYNRKRASQIKDAWRYE